MNGVFLFSIGAGTAFVITSSDNARLVEAEHPATVIAIAIANVVNFLIGDLTFPDCSELVLGSLLLGSPVCKAKLAFIYFKG